jgi:hypothetical protein
MLELPSEAISPTSDEGARGWTWPVVLGAVSSPALASAVLLYVIGAVVPYHARRLADLGAHVAAPTALGFFLANWFVRLLPLLIFLMFLIGIVLLVLIVIRSRRGPRGQLKRIVGLSALGIAILELVMSAFIMLAMHLSG